MDLELNKDFIEKMKVLLKEDFESFIKELDKEPYRALRVNTLKITTDEFKRISPFSLKPVPWCDMGFYFDNNERPGSHVFHDAGLYYIQEPSAMAVTEVLDPKPGEFVLDLSAAPGGKSTHIASKLNGEGILVANEINSKRVKILAENIERMGIKNAIILNESPDRLTDKFREYFDKILVDAPCSGEGMFRKDEIARKEWSKENVASCAARQKNILDSASEMLKPGGILVYSTCTFSPEEDEGVISDFLKKHENYDIVESNVYSGFDYGHPEWVNGNDKLKKCIRLWPHMIKGEGHFITKLKKEGINDYKGENKIKKIIDKDVKFFYDFANNYLDIDVNKLNLKIIGDHIYHIPYQLPHLSGIKVYRHGWDLGILKKNRFEPSHWLAMALKKDESRQYYKLKDFELDKYLHGETLNVDMEDGWLLVLVDEFPIGWGKVTKGILKNYYPKCLRR